METNVGSSWGKGFAVLGFVSLVACTGHVSQDGAPEQFTRNAAVRFVTTTEGTSYVDTKARCHLSLPSPDYRIAAKHYSNTLPVAKVRHRITVTPNGDKDLARIDLWDNPRGLSAYEWARQYLGYQLGADAIVTSASMGRRKLDGLLIRHPRSPQAFASRAVVMTDRHRVAVIDGSDVEDGARREAFDMLVAQFDLEVTP